MSLSQWIKRLTVQGALTELVERVAARSEAAVWSRIYPTAAVMVPHEARGYVRARSALVVHREIQIATSAEPQLSAALQHQLFRDATERVVRRTLSEIALQRPVRSTEMRAA